MGGREGGEFVCFDDMVVLHKVTTLCRTVSTVLSRVVAVYGRHSGLMVSALDFRSSSLGSSPG